jgi:hypothetical protein
MRCMPGDSVQKPIRREARGAFENVERPRNSRRLDWPAPCFFVAIGLAARGRPF